VPAQARTTGAATDADTRWALVARLLHDDTLELTDRVAGAFLLCYGQQLSRIAVTTTEQVHRHDDVVSLRFGAHDLTVPEPLSVLLTDLIDVGRSHLGVGSPTTSPWLFPGHLPGRPITPARLSERIRTLGIRALPGRRATLLQLAAEVPLPSSPNSSTSPPEPPPGGPETQEATGPATPLTSQAEAITRGEE
jgi:hypothetical protein